MTDTTAPTDVAHPGADPALRRQIEDALDLIRKVHRRIKVQTKGFE